MTNPARGTQILEDVIAPGLGPVLQSNFAKRSVHLRLTGTGAVTAEVNITGSNFPGGAYPVLLATITMSGSDDVVDAVVLHSPWAYVQAEVVGITGTSAVINGYMKTEQ